MEGGGNVDKVKLTDAEIKKRFGENLSALRKRKGLSRKKLAEIFGIAEVSLGSYERGVRQPNFGMLFSFADYFGVGVDELLGLEDVKQERIIENYRFKRALRNLSRVGRIYSTSPIAYALIVDEQEKTFQTDNDGNVKRADEGNDCICFGGSDDLIDFAEYVENAATFSNKDFKTVFYEQAEKLFTNSEMAEVGKAIVEHMEQTINQGGGIIRHATLPTRLTS